MSLGGKGIIKNGVPWGKGTIKNVQIYNFYPVA